MVFCTKIVSVRSLGSCRSLGFDEDIHLNSNQPAKTVVCAADFIHQ